MFGKLFKKSKSPVTMEREDDRQMSEAFEQARASLQSFWHQVSLDFNRIVPAIEMACIKVQFSDKPQDPGAPIEHMWANSIDFDGEVFSGILLNAPNALRRYKQNAPVKFSRSQISDWLCVIDSVTYGGFTIQLMRRRMNDQERAAFDAAWGLNFPPPETTLIPSRNEEFEVVLAELLEKEILKDPALVRKTFDEGRTLLHLSALYGRLPSVALLLRHGADRDVTCKRGWKASDYAESFGWQNIKDLLSE